MGGNAISTTPKTRTAKVGGAAAEFLDERLSLGAAIRKNLRKIFPDHWSFLLGEIALYSFVVLLLSGTFLTLFFKPSMEEIVYNGAYVPLRGVRMSEAYASTLEISFDVRGGLLMRQIHHWAALIFVASIVVHLARIFFTGAFRKPRELNWLIGVGLFTLAMVEGFAGYSLPDDLLSGTGLQIARGVVWSIPGVGTSLSFFLFGGEFPGHDLIPRLYTIHILLLPALILGLIAIHLALVVRHKHTQWPGPGRTERNVVGLPLAPVYVAKAGGYFFVVFGVCALLGGLAQINPIWLFGPFRPDQVSAGSQPDWYMGFLEGLLRVFPNWEVIVGGYTLSLNVLLPALAIPGIMFTVLALYPFLEAWLTGDKREHHLLDRPRNQATRTALGVMAVTLYALTLVGGGNDIIATHFRLSIESITWAIRVLLVAAPLLAFVITRRICLSLQRRDRDTVRHGRETGIITQLPHGEFVEVHEPISTEQRYRLTAHELPRPLELETRVDGNGVVRSPTLTSRLRVALSRWYFRNQVATPTPDQHDKVPSGH